MPDGCCSLPNVLGSCFFCFSLSSLHDADVVNRRRKLIRYSSYWASVEIMVLTVIVLPFELKSLLIYVVNKITGGQCGAAETFLEQAFGLANCLSPSMLVDYGFALVFIGVLLQTFLGAALQRIASVVLRDREEILNSRHISPLSPLEWIVMSFVLRDGAKHLKPKVDVRGWIKFAKQELLFLFCPLNYRDYLNGKHNTEIFKMTVKKPEVAAGKRVGGQKFNVAMPAPQPPPGMDAPRQMATPAGPIFPQAGSSGFAALPIQQGQAPPGPVHAPQRPDRPSQRLSEFMKRATKPAAPPQSTVDVGGAFVQSSNPIFQLENKTSLLSLSPPKAKGKRKPSVDV